MTSLENFERFRNYSYRILGNGRDALFDLMDAVLTSRSVSSFVELTLSPVFRREWSSLYEGLQDARPPRQALMQHYVAQMPEAELTVLAGDHTVWSRPYAVTLQERTYEHQPQLGVGGKPVTGDRDTAPLPGFQRLKGVGHYRCCMSASPVLRLRSPKQPPSCARCALTFLAPSFS
jgi:hypothetical protein